MSNTIIDLGCGVGNKLKRYYNKYHVVGVDIDKENIEICKKQMPNGTWIVGDIASFSIQQYENIKKIFCTEVLEHTDDWKRVLYNMNLAPQGTTLLLTIPHELSEKKLLKLKPNYWDEIGHKHFFNGNEIKQVLEQHGWHNIKIQRSNAALFFQLQLLFKRNAPCIRHTYYENTLPLPVRIFFQLFSVDLFQTKLKYFFPFWIITLPASLILNRWWGATVRVTAKK